MHTPEKRRKKGGGGALDTNNPVMQICAADFRGFETRTGIFEELTKFSQHKLRKGHQQVEKKGFRVGKKKQNGSA